MRTIQLLSALVISFQCNVFASSQKDITFLIAEREYKTSETLPQFAKQHLSEKIFIRFCRAPNEGEKRNQLSNSSAISKADLLFISVRRRASRMARMGSRSNRRKLQWTLWKRINLHDSTCY